MKKGMDSGMKPKGEMSGVAKVANIGKQTDTTSDMGYYSERGDSKGGMIDQSQKGLRGTGNYDTERDGH